MAEPKKSLLARLFGNRTKTVGVDTQQSKNAEEDAAYELGWRNRYLAARVTYLENLINSKGLENLQTAPVFNMPENVQSGHVADLEGINFQLAERVRLLEAMLPDADKGR